MVKRFLLAASAAVLVPMVGAGSFVAIAPAGVSAGQPIVITGSGFDSIATNNLVSFTPASGPAVTVAATAVATLDAASATRRLAVTVPATLPVGAVTVRVTNASGTEIADARALEIVSLQLPEAVSGLRGANGIVVRIAGSPNTRFASGTRVTLGAGITVRSTTVESATTLRATIDIAPAAALGPRDVIVISPPQRAILAGGFSVTAATPPPTNSAPIVSAGANQTVTLPAGVSLNGTVVDDGKPAGATVTATWSKTSGPGAVTFANASALATTATLDQVGTYVLRLTANDTQLTAFGEVTITVNPASPTNHKPTAQAGAAQTGETGIGVSFDGSGSTDPDGDTLTYAWTFGDSSTSADQKPFHVYATAGTFTVTLVVTDAHGASDSAATSATITAAADRAPPVVTVSAPKEALPGAHINVTAEASDNIGVASVTLDVNGADPVDVPAAPYQRVVNVPDIVAPGTKLTIGATARDAAGNVGSASTTVTVVAEPDTEKPAVQVKAPQQAAPGTVVQLAATASDNVRVSEVVFAANGTGI